MLEELDGELAATAAGGRVDLVAGEAGIGKSVLIRRFTERHAAGDRERLGETLRWLSRLHWWDGSRPGGRGGRGQGDRRAPAPALRPSAGHGYSNQAQLDMLASRTEAAMGWAAWAIDLARRLEDQETLAHALTNIGSARLQDGDLGGRAELEEALQVAVAAGLADHAAARARRRLFDPVGHCNRPDVFRLVVDGRPKPHLVSLAEAGEGPVG